jgi:hypothetical protein
MLMIPYLAKRLFSLVLFGLRMDAQPVNVQYMVQITPQDGGIYTI